MAKADNKPTTHFVEAKLEGKSDLAADPHRHAMMDIDAPVLPAKTWFAAAAARLKASPDCPPRITDAARRLETEMEEAAKRRQCDAAWTRGAIINALRDCGYWLRRYAPKS